jgi:hypothetical protein
MTGLKVLLATIFVTSFPQMSFADGLSFKVCTRSAAKKVATTLNQRGITAIAVLAVEDADNFLIVTPTMDANMSSLVLAPGAGGLEKKPFGDAEIALLIDDAVPHSDFRNLYFGSPMTGNTVVVFKTPLETSADAKVLCAD